jgi:ABC-type multidrug transport system fused ATPase/permease subunit
MSFVSILAYNFFNEPMALSELFTCLHIIYGMTEPLFFFPEYITGFLDSLISLKRIEAFLYSKEYNPSQLVSNIENNEDEENENENENIDNNENIENNQNDNVEDKKNEKENEKGNEKEEDKIMINIDNLDFGIIKKEEEFMEVEEYEAEESEDSEEEILLTKNRKKIDKSKGNQDGIELIEFNHDENENEKEKLLIDNKEDFEEKSEEIIQNLDKGEEKEVIKGTVIINLLKEINLTVKKGELIGIIGEIGSGKTCLFNAILNNLDILNGVNKKIFLNGSN